MSQMSRILCTCGLQRMLTALQNKKVLIIKYKLNLVCKIVFILNLFVGKSNADTDTEIVAGTPGTPVEPLGSK